MNEWVQGGMEGESKEGRRQARNMIQGMVFKPWVKLIAHQQKINSV